MKIKLFQTESSEEIKESSESSIGQIPKLNIIQSENLSSHESQKSENIKEMLVSVGLGHHYETPKSSILKESSSCTSNGMRKLDKTTSSKRVTIASKDLISDLRKRRQSFQPSYNLGNLKIPHKIGLRRPSIHSAVKDHSPTKSSGRIRKMITRKNFSPKVKSPCRRNKSRKNIGDFS